MKISIAASRDATDWTAMRNALWPSDANGEHAAEIARLLVDAGETVNVIARDTDGRALGFAEASLRRDYVNGCETSPVVFLEGIFVVPEARGSGVARALVAAVEDWGRAQGCSEFASDVPVANVDSQAMHKALGFAETQRVVFFKRALT